MKLIKSKPIKRTLGKYIIDGLTNVSESHEIRIPLYQRDYVWGLGKKAEKLMESLIQGYPVGSITVRQKNESGKQVNYLIDGLQRSITIVNIYRQPWKYISNNIVKKFFNSYTEGEKFKEDNIENKVFNHKLYDYITRPVREIRELDSLESVNSRLVQLKKSGNDPETQARNQAVSQIMNDIITWAQSKEELPSTYSGLQKSLYNTDISVIIIENSSDDQAAEIFNVMNTGARKLTEMEVNASLWAKHEIKPEHVKSYKNEIDKRTENYCKLITSDIESFERCKNNLRESSKFVTPADLAYAIINQIFSQNKLHKINEVFKDGEIIKDMDKMVYLIMNALKDYDFNFVSFGEMLANKANNNEILEMDKNITNSVTKFINKFDLINYTQAAEDKNNAVNSIALSELFVVFAINQIFNMSEKEYEDLEKNTLLLRFLETKVSKEWSLGSASAQKAIKALKSNHYVKNLKLEDKNALKTLVKQEITKTASIKNNFSSVDRILAWVIYSNYIYSNRGKVHLDHIIPKSIISDKFLGMKEDVELTNLINSVYNIQLLDEGKNISKGNKIFPKLFNHDILSEQKDFTDILSREEYEKELENIQTFKEKTFDKNSIRKSIVRVLKARKEIIDKKIDELFR